MGISAIQTKNTKRNALELVNGVKVWCLQLPDGTKGIFVLYSSLYEGVYFSSHRIRTAYPVVLWLQEGVFVLRSRAS